MIRLAFKNMLTKNTENTLYFYCNAPLNRNCLFSIFFSVSSVSIPGRIIKLIISIMLPYFKWGNYSTFFFHLYDRTITFVDHSLLEAALPLKMQAQEKIFGLFLKFRTQFHEILALATAQKFVKS